MRSKASPMCSATKLKEMLDAIDGSLAVSESLTAGNVQATIAAVSGASTFFAGGITAYSIDAKASLLSVDYEHASTCHCVSERVAREMAAGVRNRFDTLVGLATTGFAESWPEEGIHEPHAWCAVNIGGVVSTTKVNGEQRQRVAMQQFVAEKTIELTIDALCRIRDSDDVPAHLLETQTKLRSQAAKQ